LVLGKANKLKKKKMCFFFFFGKMKKSGIYLIYPKPESAWTNKTKNALQLQIMHLK
jgi:hypothetical protein